MSIVQNKSVQDVSRRLFHECQQKHSFLFAQPQNLAKAEQLQFTEKKNFWHRFIDRKSVV